MEREASVHQLPVPQQSFKLPSVGMTVKQVQNPHAFQMYFDFGTTKLGPFMKFGLNNLEYNMGYLPEEEKNDDENHKQKK